MISVPHSLVILGCSQRKKQTSRLIAAIDRYDGPVFRVLRKHTLLAPEEPIHTHILSGRFGLIPGMLPIPRYNYRLRPSNLDSLRLLVVNQLKQTLDNLKPDRLFVSVGRQYWPLLEEPLSRDVSPGKVVVATGSIGGRASQLAHWLDIGKTEIGSTKSSSLAHEAVLLGTTVRLTSDEVLCEAQKALLSAPVAARRFETWFVVVNNERVAAKWLVSVLFDKPVARFRTADARRVLSLLGVECKYDGRH
jgi:hypothetical protein